MRGVGTSWKGQQRGDMRGVALDEQENFAQDFWRESVDRCHAVLKTLELVNKQLQRIRSVGKL